MDPADDIGTAKIVKALFSLRNRNGGFFVLGFDDKTLAPTQANRPADIHTAFHVDAIQTIISRYASEPFEIAVGFESRDQTEHAVVAVPDGVTPLSSSNEA